MNLTVFDSYGTKSNPDASVAFVAISDISIWTLPIPETLLSGGRWGETVDFPIEIYTPYRDRWRDAARHSIPRTYHSWAMLLPDATVLVGGSGLKREHDEANHYETQIYQPSYLFTQDSKTLAKRPTILDNSPLLYPKVALGNFRVRAWS